MKRWVPWVAGALAVAVLSGAVMRLVVQRRAEQAAAAAPKAVPVLELAASDIATAARLELARGIDISGSVRAANSAFVKARVPGEIRQITVREGDAVKAGQVLVQQDASELDWRVRQADEQARSAAAQLDTAQRALNNNRALVQQGFISATALDTSVNNEAAARVNLQAARAGVELARKARGDATLTAPISGTVSQRLAQPGERVGVEARILEIVDLSRLELEAALAPDDVAALRVGSAAQLQVDGIAEPVAARVARISPSAQAGSRAVPVYLALAAHPALRHGLFARGRIELDRKSVIAVPAGAIRLDRADPYVLALDGARVVSRPVATGLRGVAGGVDQVEITQGLAEGTRVLAGTVGLVADGTAWRAATAALPPPASAAAR